MPNPREFHLSHEHWMAEVYGNFDKPTGERSEVKELRRKADVLDNIAPAIFKLYHSEPALFRTKKSGEAFLEFCRVVEKYMSVEETRKVVPHEP